MDWNSISVAGQTVLVIAYIACAAVVTRYFLWLLQSGKYRSRSYFEALMREPMRWLPLIALVIPGSMLILQYAAAGFFVTVIYFLAVLFFYLKLIYRLHFAPHQKFIMTPHMARLLVTVGAIWLALVIILLVLVHQKSSSRVRMILMIFWFMLQPMIVALALGINVPLERQIRRYYCVLAGRRIAEQPDLLTIGITGSYGKTTLKEALASILAVRFRVLQTQDGDNTRMGIARCVNEKLQPETEMFVCEIGARAQGEVEELCRIVQPQIGVITAIGSRDMESFHSLRDILKTRYALLDDVDQRGGQMFVNGDNLLIRRHMKYPDAVTYGFSTDCDYHGVLLDMDSTGSFFSVTGPEGQYGEYHTRLVGRYNLVDLMGAIAVANRSGIPMELMEEPLRNLAPAPHRLHMKMQGYTCIIDDTDNSNPDATAVALETLSMFESVRILITPGVPTRDMEGEDILPLAARAAISADYIILVGHNQTQEIYQNILEDGFHPDRIFLVDTMSDARVLSGQIAPDQQRVILLENSLPR